MISVACKTSEAMENEITSDGHLKQARPEKRRTMKQRLRRFQAWVRSRLPYGVRFLLGVLLIFGGILGFLPILGLWMLPLGIAVAALDVKPTIRRWRRWRGD